MAKKLLTEFDGDGFVARIAAALDIGGRPYITLTLNTGAVLVTLDLHAEDLGNMVALIDSGPELAMRAVLKKSA